ncbi:MAG TPA: lipid A biosynthesis acyltransferase, partial [bacterium]|nr:lipid A biosynthesis acyltransferase [bacterium]
MARPLQKIKNDLIYYAVRALLALLRRMPDGVSRRAGRAFGACFFRLAGGERRKTLRNLRTAFPDRDKAALARLAREVWR